MNINPILKHAVIDALLTVGYVLLVVAFLSNASSVFGNEEPKSFLIPTMMLLLLVLSAGVTGYLVFGKPVMWYIDGKKKESVMLVTLTFLSLFVLLLFSAVFVAFYGIK